MTNATSELASFIIDLEDEECPNFALHLAAYQGDIPQLEDLLKKPEYKENIDARIRPFLATPLRLAATGQQMCVGFFVKDKTANSVTVGKKELNEISNSKN